MKKSAIISLLLLFCICFSGCDSDSDNTNISEKGVWHSTVNISDICRNRMSSNDAATLEMLTENMEIDISVIFNKDGTFNYKIDTDKIKETLKGYVSDFTSLILDIDFDELSEEIVDCASSYSIGNIKSEMSGFYTRFDDGTIVASDEGEELFFRIEKDELIQFDYSTKEEMVVFKK